MHAGRLWCAQSPLQNQVAGQVCVYDVGVIETGRDQKSDGGPREAKRSVILLVALVSWEVEWSRLPLPSRVVVSRAHVEQRVLSDRLSTRAW